MTETIFSLIWKSPVLSSRAQKCNFDIHLRP